MKKLLFLLLFINCLLVPNKSIAEIFELCPLCSTKGELICPEGYEPSCEMDTVASTEPKCIFYGDRYVAGCYKFDGIKKLDLNFDTLLPGSKVEIIGGGETYTLNRQVIGCKLIDN